MEKSILQIVNQLRSGFRDKQNHSLKQRLHHLNLLEQCLTANEEAFMQALAKDFNKPRFETYLTEIFPVLDEIRYFQKNLKSLMRPEGISTPLQLFPATSGLYHEPKGVVLIIGAWNYPVTLTLVPLVGAIASGNTVLLKPSEIASHTSAVIARLLGDVFPGNVLQVAEGDGAFTAEVLDHKFDHVFYTGSTHVGKIVYQKAAAHLSPVTLELGGKSPAIFHKSANLKKGVKRLLWGKFLNGGQTCVAPDYALVPVEMKKEFLKRCIDALTEFFPVPEVNQSVIINDKHFQRITALLDGEHTLHLGGNSNEETRYIEPTIIEIFSPKHPAMQEEIFGPILPVYFYKSTDEIRQFYDNSPDPLAMYIFSTSNKFTEEIIENYPAGGVMVNDVIMHLANLGLPFGGRGTSGFGNYRGEHSFRTFSHAKSVMRQANWIDPAFRYQPYSAKKLGSLKRLIGMLRWLR